MVRKFLRKVSKNCESFEKQTTQPEFSTGKSNGTEISGKKSAKLWVYPGSLSSFPKFRIPILTGIVRN